MHFEWEYFSSTYDNKLKAISYNYKIKTLPEMNVYYAWDEIYF